MDPTTVTLSMEIELAWGFHDKPDGNTALSRDGEVERAVMDGLLARCDAYGIPFSFDVVGHLLHEGCRGTHDSPHRDDWFDADPGTDVNEDPLYYAPDIVRSITEAETDHEICTHTYSHALCEQISEETLRWELSRVQEVFDDYGITPTVSFVPPRHQEPSRHVLREFGIEVLWIPFPENRSAPGFGKVGTFLWTLARSHPLTGPVVADGILETYCTFHPSLTVPYLPKGNKPPHPIYTYLPEWTRKRLHRRYLEQSLAAAVERDTPIHLWTHLYELGCAEQWSTVSRFLESLGEYQDRGLITVRTMDELPETVRRENAA